MVNYINREDINAYFKCFEKYPVLSDDEEFELGKEVLDAKEKYLRHKTEKNHKDYIDARNELVNSNLRLVINVVKNYRDDKNFDFLDLIQEGNIGLLKAAEKFDYRKGYKFSTLASKTIKDEICCSIKRKTNSCRIKQKKSISLDNSNTCKNDFFDEFYKNELENIVNVSINTLKSLQIEIIKMRYGVCGWMGKTLTFCDIGKNLGISRQGVQQSKDRIIVILRNSLKAKYLNGYFYSSSETNLDDLVRPVIS